ncbi:fimbrial protein [Candidatus Magnetobacterium bavaricum]|uniref:Fimbrial protein n=1 Tax=Candidatus Magnetobacterium bavaricum TaxID=29290 RepID=A0A0F3GY41_9BACT|nr:fimbrial protein [Candidatus Magnetobacterium bavaricum]
MNRITPGTCTIDERGFTLIELLIVIAIIGILTAIAVPAFLGQREKAKVRAVEAGARAAVADLQGYLDSYVAGDPCIVSINSIITGITGLSATGSQGCLEASNASATGKTCKAVYNQSRMGRYTAYPSGITSVLNLFVSHHTNKGDKSPFTGGQLFVSTHTTEGEIFLTPTGNSSISITAYATDTTSPIFSQIVSAK